MMGNKIFLGMLIFALVLPVTFALASSKTVSGAILPSPAIDAASTSVSEAVQVKSAAKATSDSPQAPTPVKYEYVTSVTDGTATSTAKQFPAIWQAPSNKNPALLSGKHKSGEIVRVIVSEPEKIDAASSGRCTFVSSFFSNYKRMFSVMNCPGETVDALNLHEDQKIYTLDLGSNQLIGADRVHAKGNLGQGIRVGVLDTGIDYNHPDLATSYLGGYDEINHDPDPMDDHGHGTFISGIITADHSLLIPAPFGIGRGISSKYGPARGTAPSAGVYAIKVIDSFGIGWISNFIAGVYIAIDGPDRVYGTADDPHLDAISASLGTTQYHSTFCDDESPEALAAIEYAESRGVPVVIAAGNDGLAGTRLPGCITKAITVGAVDKTTDTIASFSSRGWAVDITAPGTDMYSTVMGGGYLGGGSGTSDSTPVVSGVVALMKKVHPDYSVNQIKQALRNTAVYKSGTQASLNQWERSHNRDYGWGRVNAYDAVYGSKTGLMHTMCKSNACVLVNGAGNDECSSSAECFCTDTDGGKNYYSQGTAEGISDQTGKWDSKYDICLDSSTLKEYYCEGKHLKAEIHACLSNEYCTAATCVVAVPDLIVIINAPAQMTINQQYFANISTFNVNNGVSGPSRTKYFVNNVSAGEIQVPALQTYQGTTVSVPISCSKTGPGSLSAKADHYDQVNESNENNNWASAGYACVLSPVPVNSTVADTAKQKKPCSILLPIEVDCASVVVGSVMWYDLTGCPYTCKTPTTSISTNEATSSKTKSITGISTGTVPASSDGKKTPPQSDSTGSVPSKSGTTTPGAVSDVVSDMVDAKG